MNAAGEFEKCILSKEMRQKVDWYGFMREQGERFRDSKHRPLFLGKKIKTNMLVNELKWYYKALKFSVGLYSLKKYI